MHKSFDGNFGMDEYVEAAHFDGRDASEYKHTYYIKNPKQLIPRYVARVTMTEKNVSSDEEPEVAAESEKPNVQVAEFYDASTFKPTYPQKERANSTNFRQYVTLEKAFENAINSSETVDDILGDKKEIIESTLSTLDERVRQINMNYAECHESIVHAHDTGCG